MGIDTHQEPVVFMRADCNVCKAEGFTANARIQVVADGRSIIATLNVVNTNVLPKNHIGFSVIAWQRLDLQPNDLVHVRHAPTLTSMSAVRKKVYGHQLSAKELTAIIADISAHRYSDIEIASFLTACAGDRLNEQEILALTQAMVACGQKLSWSDHQPIFDKHCIGGLPGNRATPIIIAIVSAAGLIIPKTSSRAITSPAGTADTMEVLTRVNLTLEEMRQVVAHTHGCLAWGGAVNLSPADDIMIRIERTLDLDSEGQLIASVLSKKIAAGSTHVLIDLPVGATAKVRTEQQAQRLIQLFEQVGAASGLVVRCVITDGSQAVGWGVGPVEEARDVLAVLKNLPEAPQDLRDRALFLAANLLSMAHNKPIEQARLEAEEILSSQRAWQQFKMICEAQGGLKLPLPIAEYQKTMTAQKSGVLVSMDNRRVARLAKLAGAPFSPVAGLRLAVKIGDIIQQDQILLTLFAASKGELAYAEAYYSSHLDMLLIQ